MAKPPGPAPVDPLKALDAALAKAREAERRGDAKAALAALEAAPPEAKQLGSLHFARGSILFRRGDLPGAIAAFRQAVKLDREIPEFLANLGAALVESHRRSPAPGALEEAIATLERAASLGPRTALAHNNLGMAYQAASRLDDALAAFDEAIAREPRDVNALYNRAATLHMLGREEECLSALDAVLEIQPNFQPAIQSRANT
ncbi:MAG TPA: tetratricopeptide repeat protein, partial [Planctomycetota bacterium]|nr:tetratricopeptide repeat protein [Planctomycetota bacterium]